MEDVFIRSLVSAGTCRTCAASSQRSIWSSVYRPGRESRDGKRDYTRTSRRAINTNARSQQPYALATAQDPESNDISREEYKQLVNTYDSPSDMWEESVPPPRPPSAKTKPPREHFPLAPRLVLTAEQEERLLPSPRIRLNPEHPSHIATLRNLRNGLKTDLGTHTNELWHHYNSLPSPRASYLDDRSIRRLFRQLAWVEFKADESNASRYLTVLQDCLDVSLQPTPGQWNTAIAFAGRRNRRVITEDLKRAVEMWLNMDNAGVDPEDATFSILYDVATRAGRFALADTVLGELVARGLELNRFQRTSVIFNAGIRKDGDGVRRAFREFVNAGEIVDTAVMNCVILSLVRAGEVASAENVVQKMKNLHATKREPAVLRTWQEDKILGKKLNADAQRLRQEKADHEASFFGSMFSNQDHKEEVQRKAPIAPDFRTRRILVRCHCVVTGNLEKVRELMAEMREDEEGRVQGNVYVWLFVGFYKWGGYPFTEWSRKALESFWKEFVDAATDGAPTTTTTHHDPQTYTPFVDQPLGDSTASGADTNQSSKNNNDDPNETEADPDPNDPFPKSFTIEEHLSYTQRRPHFSTFVASRAILAFYRCAGPKRARAVWLQIREVWVGMREDERERILREVGPVLRG